eukprot:gene23685-9225_t
MSTERVPLSTSMSISMLRIVPSISVMTPGTCTLIREPVSFRLLTLFAYRDLLGRLPIGPLELDAIADSSTDPERSIVKKFGWPITEKESVEPVTVATDSRWSWDALLFHENTSTGAPEAQDTHCVNQVKNFFVGTHPTMNSQGHSMSNSDERPSTFEAVLDRYASRNNATGTDKTTSHAYGPLYSTLFGEMRDRGGERGTHVKTILEIGVFSGASVQAFADFFPTAAVVGLDITLDNVVFGRDDPRVTFVKGDGTNSRFAELSDRELEDEFLVPRSNIRLGNFYAGGSYGVISTNAGAGKQSALHGTSFE